MGVNVIELQSNDQAEYKSTTVFSEAKYILLITYIYINIYGKSKGKVKVIQLQARCGPEGR